MALTREQAKKTMTQYLDFLRSNDLEGIMSLYVDEPRVEDPIGSEPKIGRTAVREFYARPRDFLFVEQLGTVSVNGNYVGFTFHIALNTPKGQMHVLIPEVLTLTDEGLIATMTAVPDYDTARDDVAAAYPESEISKL